LKQFTEAITQRSGGRVFHTEDLNNWSWIWESCWSTTLYRLDDLSVQPPASKHWKHSKKQFS